MLVIDYLFGYFVPFFGTDEPFCDPPPAATLYVSAFPIDPPSTKSNRQMPLACLLTSHFHSRQIDCTLCCVQGGFSVKILILTQYQK